MNEDSTSLVCHFHPKRETRLRCNKCGKPICIKCAQHTPTGYRCPECIRSQQKIFITAKWHDYLIGILISSILSFLGSFLAAPMGFFTIFVAPFVAYIIVVVIRKLIKNRRAPRLYWIVGVSALIASFPLLFIRIMDLVLGFESWGLGVIFPLAWQGLYTFLVTTTAYYQISQ